ncbi:hypothetical protein K438DRAFT_1848000 [Mycena galopus ATCC 62051]|nr:hypothetical protein K438DRAFT_1848000 [Mycena galopus ATCC 62051]
MASNQEKGSVNAEPLPRGAGTGAGVQPAGRHAAAVHSQRMQELARERAVAGKLLSEISRKVLKIQDGS